MDKEKIVDEVLNKFDLLAINHSEDLRPLSKAEKMFIKKRCLDARF